MEPGGHDAPIPVVWTRRWDTAAEHERMARIHRGEAATLHAAYEEACGTRGLDVVSVSPLQRYGIGVSNNATGVTVYLDRSAGTPDTLLADLRCHRAWMMLAPSGMDDCPLDLPGLRVDAQGDGQGISLALSTRDPKLIPELQRRVAMDLEAKHQHK